MLPTLSRQPEETGCPLLIFITEEMIYYYTYLITNTKQNKFYIGSRQCEVDPVKDLGIKYFSSSLDKDFIRDQKKNPDDYEYIVLGLFSIRNECMEGEMELHETYEVSSNPSFYNRAKQTSTGFNTSGKVNVKDTNGNTMQVTVDDPRFLSGELVGVTKGTVTVKDTNGNLMQVTIDDPRFLSGELVSKNRGMFTAKDKDGNLMQVTVDDPRFLSGELVGQNAGKHHCEEAKIKIGKATSIAQSGSGNSQYGTMWITNPTEKRNMKIKKTDTIPDGWAKGRKIYC